VALFPANGMSGNELVKNAVAALHEAKKAGRNAFRFYSAELRPGRRSAWVSRKACGVRSSGTS
jgi:predicted signal transduction protein with EAL and GGDEF domain